MNKLININDPINQFIYLVLIPRINYKHYET